MSTKFQLEDLKLSGLTVSEQISIIDVTLACLVSWLEGHSLAQTVFTNLYFQNPYKIDVAPLKAFCICIYKIIEAIRDFANRFIILYIFNYLITVCFSLLNVTNMFTQSTSF